MKKAIDAPEFLESRAGQDSEFRARLLASPKDAIEQELGVRLPADHEIHVHEESYSTTHLVLPPLGKLTREERRRPGRALPRSSISRRRCTIPPLRFVLTIRNRSLPGCVSWPPRHLRKRVERASDAVSLSSNRLSTTTEPGTASGTTWPTRAFHGTSKDLPLFRLSACWHWKVAMKRGPKPCVQPAGPILSTRSSIRDSGATTAIYPRISTARRFVPL